MVIISYAFATDAVWVHAVQQLLLTNKQVCPSVLPRGLLAVRSQREDKNTILYNYFLVSRYSEIHHELSAFCNTSYKQNKIGNFALSSWRDPYSMSFPVNIALLSTGQQSLLKASKTYITAYVYCDLPPLKLRFDNVKATKTDSDQS